MCLTVYVCVCVCVCVCMHLCKCLVFKIYFVNVCQHTPLCVPSFPLCCYEQFIQRVSSIEHVSTVDPVPSIMCNIFLRGFKIST